MSFHLRYAYLSLTLLLFLLGGGGLLLQGGMVGGHTVEVRLGVVLPAQNVKTSQDPCFSALPIFSAYSLVIRRVNQLFAHHSHGHTTPSLSSHSNTKESTHTRPFTIKAFYIDSRCSDTYGPLHAVRLYYKESVNVLYGPCCKNALSPVARYANIWNIPIMTPGGLTPAFSNKTMYPLLTRIISPYEKAILFLSRIFKKLEYKTFSVLWHTNLYKQYLGNSECHETAITLINRIRMTQHGREPHKNSFDEAHFDLFDWNHILNNIRKNSRSMYPLLFIQ